MKKIKLTRLQNRIIWILEEAGEETLGTVQATLRVQGVYTEEELATALAGLRQLGFVPKTSSSLILTDNGRAALCR